MAVGNIQLNLPSGQTTCTQFTAMSVDPTTGDITVTCKPSGPVDPTLPGTVSLSAVKYTTTKATTTTSATVNIQVQRVGGSSGPLNGLLQVSGTGCSLQFTDVSFTPADATTKSVPLTATTAGTGICTLTLTSNTSGGLGSPASATVDVNEASGGGGGTPIPGCGTIANNVVVGTLLTSGLAGRLVDKARTDGLPPTIYSYKLPKIPGGAFFTTRDPDTPPSLTVDIAISKCPGDYEYYKDPTEVYTFPWAPTTPFYPCMSFGSAESAVVRWDSTLGMNNCKVNVADDYYVNVRITDDKGVYACPAASANGPGCPMRFWWN